MSRKTTASLQKALSSQPMLRDARRLFRMVDGLRLAPQVSRRNFLKQTGVISLLMLLAGCVPIQPVQNTTSGKPQGDAGGSGLTQVDLPDLAGTVLIADRGVAKIHTYVSPADANANATHVIESDNALVLVDAQFFVPFAQEFRGYVDGLGKPIDRIIISHSHPDHYWGLSTAFADVPAYALAETIGAIEEGGAAMLEMQKPDLGDLAPDTIRVPDNTIAAGAVVIDGITYAVKHYTDAEDMDQIVIELPDLASIITQDLVYNQIHLFTAANLENWAIHLEELKGLTQFTLGLAGHGMPFENKIVYDNVIGYLQKAGEILGSAEGMEDYITGIAEAYPDYQGGLHELSAAILFGEM